MEVCDGVDNNCDGVVDVGRYMLGATTWYVDRDYDGYGRSGSGVTACRAPSGSVAIAGDCNDGNKAIRPGVPDICGDGVDADCSGEPDPVRRRFTFFVDKDGDSFGDPNVIVEACDSAPAGYVGVDPSVVDCDDAIAKVHPFAAEVCDSRDNDCNGVVDDGIILYADADGDGWGDPDALLIACDEPPGYILDDSDCDDGSDVIHPDAEEVCDSVDNDCRNGIDDPTATDAIARYLDADGDGYGDPAVEEISCPAIDDYVEIAGDCDDGDPDIDFRDCQ
jgi:Putative metal-binding motif